MSWSAKRAGFESGNSGNSGYGRFRKPCRTAVVPDIQQFKHSLLLELDADGIVYDVESDGTIVANLPGRGWVEKTPEMLEEDYKEYVNKLCGREVYLIA